MCRFEFIATLMLSCYSLATDLVPPDDLSINIPLPDDAFSFKEFLHLQGLTEDKFEAIRQNVYEEVPLEEVVGVMELTDPLYQEVSLRLFAMAGFTKTQFCFVEYVYQDDMILQLGHKCEPKRIPGY